MGDTPSVRGFLGGCLDFEEFQSKIIENWKEEIPDKNVLLEDATCYEVYIRFPTDTKLLWEACEWLWAKRIPYICKKNKLKVPRSKYKEQHKKHLVYSKLRKKSHRKTMARRRVSLHLLLKGITEFQGILNQTKAVDLSPRDAKIFKTIKLIYQQQKYHLDNPKAKIPDRIVSIYKPYIRPIVRGKENKPVEFGMKATDARFTRCKWEVSILLSIRVIMPLMSAND